MGHLKLRGLLLRCYPSAACGQQKRRHAQHWSQYLRSPQSIIDLGV
jgi:hypothetical protein